MDKYDGEYSTFEEDFVEKKLALIRNDAGNKWIRMNPEEEEANPKFKMFDGSSIGWGKSEGVVCTNPEDLLAWYFAFDSNQNLVKHEDQNGPDFDKFPSRIEEARSEHNHIIYSCRKMPFPLSPRDFLHRGIWKKIDSDTFLLGYHYCDEDELEDGLQRATAGGVVRGQFQCAYHMKRIGGNCTKLTYIARVDVKGMVPAALANTGIGGMVETVNRACDYFRPREEDLNCDRDDEFKDANDAVTARDTDTGTPRIRKSFASHYRK